jgi:hypothetical protein
MNLDIRQVAGVLIGRHFHFASLAIMLLCVARMDEPFVALTAGGLLNLALGAAMAILALNAPRRDFHRTDLWRAVGGRLRLPLHAAERVVIDAHCWAYWRFARTAATAGTLFVVMGAAWHLALGGTR